VRIILLSQPKSLDKPHAQVDIRVRAPMGAMSMLLPSKTASRRAIKPRQGRLGFLPSECAGH
jgi:hypothetical protein